MLPTPAIYVVSLDISKTAVPTRAAVLFLKMYRGSFILTFVSQFHLKYTQKFSSYLTKELRLH